MVRLLMVWVAGLLAVALAHAVGPDNSTLANDPDYRAAEAFIQQNKYAEALPHLLSIERDIKNNADVYNYLGLVYRKHRDFITAKQYYDRALTIDPEHRGALAYQGEWFLETGDAKAARANLARLTALCLGCRETRELREAMERAGAPIR